MLSHLKIDQHLQRWQTKNGKPLVLGKEPRSHSIKLQSNDYLCMSNHPKVIKAQIDALRMSVGSLNPIMSAVFLHDSHSQAKLEEKMAKWMNFEGAVLTQSGWAANVGLMEVICESSMPVYIDRFAHMSLYYGITIAKGKAIRFSHNDMQSLKVKNKKIVSTGKRNIGCFHLWFLLKLELELSGFGFLTFLPIGSNFKVCTYL